VRYDTIFNLRGRVAVVTGGAGLIGKELVRGLAESGAVVICAELDGKRGKATADRLKKGGLDVDFQRLDITDERSVARLIRSLDKRFGRIDIWVNNAYPKTKNWGTPFEKFPARSWKRNVDMHLNGYFICCQKVAEYMRSKRRGSIINFASTYGIVGPDFSIYKDTEMTVPGPYSAIKGGMVIFTRYLASYYGKYNVRVNSVSPGGVFDGQPRTFVKRYAAKTPLGRMAKGEDIVGGVLYLASDAARYVTGHNLVIDGGWTVI